MSNEVQVKLLKRRNLSRSYPTETYQAEVKVNVPLYVAIEVDRFMEEHMRRGDSPGEFEKFITDRLASEIGHYLRGAVVEEVKRISTANRPHQASDLQYAFKERE